MQATLAFVFFAVANAHGPQPVRPRPVGPHPVEPRPVGPHPVRPRPSGGDQPFGCPQSPITPEVGSYCSSPELECYYPSMGLSFTCGRDMTWRDDSSPSQSCFKDGHSYRDGFKFINSQGCTEWQCRHGTITYNSCPAPPHGCFKDGRTYPNHYQPAPDAAGCVEWQCENGKIRYNPCPAHKDGCWRNGYFYHDGFTKYTTDGRHCAIWQCSNGHIEYLGACPEKRQCRYRGRQYADGYKHYENGCATWMCSDGTIRWLGNCPSRRAQCEHNGALYSIGTRIEHYKHCATAECTKQNDGSAKFTCVLY